MAEMFGSWEALIAAVEAKIPVILETDVAPIAENILKRHIQSDIYGAYSPKAGGYFGGKLFTTAYSRRGGLPGSVYSKLGLSGTDYELLITSDESANTPVLSGYSWSLSHPGAFLQMLEEGGFGLWRNGFSRPAVANAQSEINSSGAVASAIKRGIKREIG